MSVWRESMCICRINSKYGQEISFLHFSVNQLLTYIKMSHLDILLPHTDMDTRPLNPNICIGFTSS